MALWDVNKDRVSPYSSGGCAGAGVGASFILGVRHLCFAPEKQLI